MSLFDKPHIVTVPKEYLADDDPTYNLSFKQLNSKKMAKAKLSQTLESIKQGNVILELISDKARTTQQSEAREDAKQKAEELDTFDKFDQHTLVALAHVRYREGDDWKVLTDEEIDDLLCLDWLAGQIYDVSKPKSAKAREKN